MTRWALIATLLLQTGCLKVGTWSGDVYQCDRELLESVAGAKAAFQDSPQMKGK